MWLHHARESEVAGSRKSRPFSGWGTKGAVVRSHWSPGPWLRRRRQKRKPNHSRKTRGLRHPNPSHRAAPVTKRRRGAETRMLKKKTLKKPLPKPPWHSEVGAPGKWSRGCVSREDGQYPGKNKGKESNSGIDLVYSRHCRTKFKTLRNKKKKKQKKKTLHLETERWPANLLHEFIPGYWCAAC